MGNKPRVYVDMDGVLADFDTGYHQAFNIRADKAVDGVDWTAVRKFGHFFTGLSMMPGALDLWAFLQPWDPTILSGVPPQVPSAATDKRRWCDWHLGLKTKLITCKSSEKYKYCAPGDILIDDWEKYKYLWTNVGGIWITHKSTETTIEQFKEAISGSNRSAPGA